MPKKGSQPQQGQPTVSASQGARMIRELVDQGRTLAQNPVARDDYEQWKIEVEQALSDALGQNHPGIWPVVSASTKPAPSIVMGLGRDDYVEPTDAEQAQQRATDVGMQIKLLMAHARTLEARAAAIDKQPSAVPTGEAPLQRVRTLLDRFHDVARQLRRRHDGRETLKIADEYDVQDLLHSLLLIDFQDVRPEEHTPSTAGAHGRMDLVMKPERIVVEVKMTRDKLGDKAIGDQLLVDIGRYDKHPDCGTLICFVYDPESLLKNPRGLEADLTKQVSPAFRVITVIRPR
jgi:hypothetical protein